MTDATRFWAKVNRAGPAECWLWNASKTCGGYGQFLLKGRPLRAHYALLEMLDRDIPDGSEIAQSCGEPLCVNPTHLVIKKSKTIEERFWEKVSKSGECWEWSGGKDPCGYGTFRTPDGVMHAHRFSYRSANGSLPTGMVICHKCDNPGCVRPDHLFAGTNQDNMDDRNRKGRQASKLKPYDVVTIRELLNKGVPQARIAEQWGLTQSSISHIKSGRNWAHIPIGEVR